MNHVETNGRRSQLKPTEKRQIATSTIETRELAKIYGVKPSTVLKYRTKTVKGIAIKHGYATDEPAIKSLIDAYEDGRFARRKWGDGAACHYKDEHRVAWKLGYDSK